jgi:hypothetical protein
MTIRKTVTVVEEINSEYGARVSPPLRLKSIVERNPNWRQYCAGR